MVTIIHKDFSRLYKMTNYYPIDTSFHLKLPGKTFLFLIQHLYFKSHSTTPGLNISPWLLLTHLWCIMSNMSYTHSSPLLCIMSDGLVGYFQLGHLDRLHMHPNPPPPLYTLTPVYIGAPSIGSGQCRNLQDTYIYSTDRDLIWDIVSPWLYQSRAGAKRRLETDAARVIQCLISNRGLHWFYFTPFSSKSVMTR